MAFVDIRRLVDSEDKPLYGFEKFDWVCDNLGDLLDAFDSADGWKVVNEDGVDGRTMVKYHPDQVRPDEACKVLPDLDVGVSSMYTDWECGVKVKEIAPVVEQETRDVQEVVVQEVLSRYRPDVGVKLVGTDWNNTKVLHQMVSVSSWCNSVLDVDPRLLLDTLHRLQDERVGKEVSLALRFFMTAFCLRTDLLGTFSSYQKRWRGGWNCFLRVKPLASSKSGTIFDVFYRRASGKSRRRFAWRIIVPGAEGRTFHFVSPKPRVRCADGTLELWSDDHDRDFVAHERPLIGPVRVHADAVFKKLRKQRKPKGSDDSTITQTGDLYGPFRQGKHPVWDSTDDLDRDKGLATFLMDDSYPVEVDWCASPPWLARSPGFVAQL